MLLFGFQYIGAMTSALEPKFEFGINVRENALPSVSKLVRFPCLIADMSLKKRRMDEKKINRLKVIINEKKWYCASEHADTFLLIV